MSVPKYDDLMLPLLKSISDDQEHKFADLLSEIAIELGLSEKDLRALLPSGQQSVYYNRIGWAKTYLKKAKLIESPKRGFCKITARGHEILKQNPQKIDSKFLMQFKEFQAFQTVNIDISNEKNIEVVESEQTPEELLENVYKKINFNLGTELIERMLECEPFFFEKLVIDLLLNMGYGGNRKDAGKAFKITSDGGLDGIIKEDKLGLDVIYVQAKRWKIDNRIGRPEIQKFAGALQGVRARKGVFITTSSFSKDAIEYADNIESRIILIDGKKLTEYMIESNTGVSTIETYQVKKIDTDYFQDNQE